MKKIFFAVVLLVLATAAAWAHEPFTLVSSEKKTINADDLIKVEKERTLGKIAGTTLTFAEKDIRLVIVTGPEDDMLSYRIQGVRNPTLVVPAGATLKILFVNKDGDMRHDVRFGHIQGEFAIAPPIEMTAGTNRLDHMADETTMLAEEIVVKAVENGVYKYFCSVRGHAKGGMWGNIAVGVSPGDVTQPERTTHVHSADEDSEPPAPAGGSEHQHDHNMPGMKPTPTPGKPHDMSDMPGMKPTPSPTPHDMSDMPGMDHDHHGEMAMTSTVNIADPMSRESSGTAWAPDSTAMHMHSKTLGNGDTLMFHWSAFLRYKSVGSSRDISIAGRGGRSRFDAPSTFMLVYTKPINERSQISFRGHFSLDPLIQRGWGYPLLYQSGELYRGQPIHDRQHPHDLFSELGVVYSYKFNDKRSFYLYAGYPGEPALGPPTFVHRASAANNPDAPISHHWQDSTHITFGVVTAGYSFGKVKIEASAFKGTEPDENRWNFDAPKLNSFSGRLSFNPAKNWAFQISHGYIKNPERGEPELKIQHRTTASAIYNKQFDKDRNWASSLIWGNNYGNGESTNAFLFESNYDFQKNAVFGRFETVQKSGHELVIDQPLDNNIYWVTSTSAGYVRDIVSKKGIDLGLGAMFTLNTNPATLSPVYGGTTHGGWQVFMRLRPSKMH